MMEVEEAWDEDTKGGAEEAHSTLKTSQISFKGKEK